MSLIQVSGSRWWKVDFHAHSPMSFDFGAEEGKRAQVETTIEDWILSYMAAGIDALVVTDHNSHLGIDEARRVVNELRASASSEFRELVILAGAELTVDGGYHLLAVFDSETPGETVNGLIHTCKFRGERGTSDETTSLSFEEVIEAISEVGGIAIPAHADGPRGYFKHDPRNRASIVKAGRVFAAEATTTDGARRIADLGWTPILGSDAHHLDASGAPDQSLAKFPGSHFSWVKMETPNLAGLKLALTDGSTSVLLSSAHSGDPNLFGHSVIEQLTVSADGESVTHTFSPWMNAVIGGRGVGKSTVMELARLALGRFDDLPDQLRRDQAWFSPDPARPGETKFWNASTEIEVLYRRSNRLHRITWRGNAPGSSQIEVWENEKWTAQEGAARDRFPVLLNSQKQIYETAKDPQHLLKLIDAQPQVDFPGWFARFQELAAAFRTERSEVAALKEKIGGHGRLSGELADIQSELDILSGLKNSPEIQELNRLIREDEARSEQDDAVDRFIEAVGGAIDRLPSQEELVDVDEAGNDEEQRSWPAELDWEKALEEAKNSVGLSIAKLKEAQGIWLKVMPSSPRTARILELRAGLMPVEADGVAASDADDYLLETDDEKFTRLSARKAEVGRLLRDIDAARGLLSSAQATSDTTLSLIRDHRSALTERRKDLVKTLAGDDLKLAVFAQAENSLAVDLRRLMNKPTSFDLVFGDDGLTSALKVNRKNPAYVTALEAFKHLLKEVQRDGKKSVQLASAGITPDARFFLHLETLDANQFEVEVDLWFPEDLLSVTHKPEGEGNFRDLSEGSPGQKTAALLALVLQVGNDPLLLDQPEDDLDNKLIYDLVVRTLKRIKTRRQVIVVTHNANVVVNADAEKVLIMEHAPLPKAAVVGSIQNEDIRQSICLIMEGGTEAFEARYQRLLH
jgi:hypothetical protein